MSERKRARQRARYQADQSILVGHGRAVPYAFTTPALILVAAILVFPVGYTIYGSFFQQRILDAGTPFVGLQNYKDLFASPEFWSALSKSFIFLTGILVIGTVLSVIFALALLRAVGGLRILRTMTLLPYLVSGVATAVLFRLLFNREFGLPNQVLELFGIDGLSWLADPKLAMLAVILAQLWGDLPICILLILGGLQTIDPEYLDAAQVDGASGWQRIRRIYLPLTRPQLLLCTIFLSYGGVGAFAVILALTGGGPGTATEILGLLMYRTAFQRLDLGQALAIVVTLLVANCVLVLLFAWVGRERKER